MAWVVNGTTVLARPGPQDLPPPDVGDLHLGYESMPLEHSHKQRFVVFFAEPGTADHDKLILLDAEHREPGSGLDGAVAAWCSRV